MTPAWRQLLLRALAVAFVSAVMVKAIGVYALIFCAPLAGVLLAGPLAGLGGSLGRVFSWLAWRDVDGRHYAHRGRHIDVLEDDDGHRWLRAADLRKITPGLPADERLLALFPAATRRFDGGSGAYLEAEAVVARVLSRAQEPATLKLVHWIDREVAGPARRRRGARGISPQASPGTAAAPPSEAPRTPAPEAPSRARDPGA